LDRRKRRRLSDPDRGSESEQYAEAARLHLALGDAEAAQRSLARALTLSPRDPELLRLSAEVELSRGRPKEALEAFDRFLEVARSSPPQDRVNVYRRKAQVQLDLKDLSGADRSVEKALALAPGDLESLRLAVRIGLAQSRPARALAYADRLVQACAAASPGDRAEAERERDQVRLQVRAAEGEDRR
jgi:uncharacterized protein HemY